MNKADLVSAMSTAADISRAQATKALDAALDSIGEALQDGQKVTLVNFGTFMVTERAERTGRNPASGEPLTIPAKKVVRFKPGKELSSSVNGD
jgi:DNA-binding protein HU-beta